MTDAPATNRRPVPTYVATRPPRPRRPVPAELDFEPQRPTRWYNPDVLVNAGVRHVLTSVFGSFLDKRELQSTIPARADLRFAGEDELWVDYIADTGDGFDSAYTMASVLARPVLRPDGCDLPLSRGRLLVLGGDEVYPAATTENYEQRLSGPFRAALPWTVGDHPTLYALPGNHDWYDGLTGFLRLFGQQRWIGGWTTRQTRSYFAVQLPHRWWLWGMDVPTSQFVDEPQLRFFAQVLAQEAREGDRLVLAVPEPSWVDTETRADAYRNIAYVERTLLRPHGVRLEVVVGGNLHHYARYSPPEGVAATGAETAEAGAETAETETGAGTAGGAATPRGPRHLLTVGGGGAFLHPTHDLPRAVDVPTEPGRAEPTARYERAATYPTTRRSRFLAWAAVGLPLRNPGFLWVGAAVHIAVLWTNQFGLRSLSEERAMSYATSARRSGWFDMVQGLVRNPIGGVGLTMVAIGLVALARRPPWARRPAVAWAVRVALGVAHAAAHVAVLVLVALLAIRLASGLGIEGADGGGAAFVLATTVLVGVLGGVATAVVVGLYFAVANTLPGLRVHGNEAFSAARLERHRCFLRMHVDRRGRLELYVIGVDRVVHRWRADPDAAPTPAAPDRRDDRDRDGRDRRGRNGERGDGGRSRPGDEPPWLVPDASPPPRPHLVERLTVE